MKNPTIERINELLKYDPMTGVFTWKKSRGRVKSGNTAGCLLPDGYIEISIDGKLFKAHRIAMLLSGIDIENLQVDHINGIRSDNRFSNLRPVSHAGNCQNRRYPQENNSLGVLGVYLRRKRFVAQIQVGGKNKYIGTFDTKEEAHEAYLNAKRNEHETCSI